MESNFPKYAFIATIWLLSICITTQCAIHETNQGHEKTIEQNLSKGLNTSPTENHTKELELLVDDYEK